MTDPICCVFMQIHNELIKMNKSLSKLTLKPVVHIHWFRKGLRVHDNPALRHALSREAEVLPLFILDPWFAKPEFVGVNRYAFLLETLADLQKSLKAQGL